MPPTGARFGSISGATMLAVNCSGRGIDVRNLDGSLRYHRDTPAPVDNVYFLGGRAFLIYRQPVEGWSVLDLDSGTLHPTTVGSIPTLIPRQPEVPPSAASGMVDVHIPCCTTEGEVGCHP